MPLQRFPWLVLAAGVGWACLFPSDGCGCPPLPYAAVVHGRVGRPTGAPAADVAVMAYIASDDGCVVRAEPDSRDRTDDAGRYGLELIWPSETTAICVRLRFQPPGPSGSSSVLDTTVDVAFRPTAPIDSVEVQTVLGQ